MGVAGVCVCERESVCVAREAGDGRSRSGLNLLVYEALS